MITTEKLDEFTVDSVPVAVWGECSSGYERVLAAFVDNFRSRRELGASVCVYRHGKKVVDLWGGHRDVLRQQVWTPDTLVTMASVVKGMLAFALHMLADRGKLDYDSPVARYWPEFAQAGKEHITVRQAISHHAAIHMSDHAKPGDLFRWDPFVRAIEKQAPEWAPGTRGAYHTLTIIPILCELIARTSGMPAWDFFRQEITEKLGVEYHIRMTAAELARFSADVDTEHFIQHAKIEPEVFARFFRGVGNPATDLTPEEQAQIPLRTSAGNARGAARLFAFAAENGEIEGKRVLSPRTIDLMTEVQWHEKCAVWGTPMRTALGLLLNDPAFFYIGPNPNAFGTAGGGGSFAMADRDNHLSAGYALNRWWPALALGERARHLIDAVYASI